VAVADEDFDHGRYGLRFIVAFGTAGLEARLNTIICIIGDLESRGQVRPLRWVGASRSAVKSFPRAVRLEIGQGLYAAQRGETDPAAKALNGFGGRSVLEVVAPYDGDTWRAVYTAKPCNLRELLEKMRSHLDIAYDYDDVWGTETGSLAAVPAATAERIRLLPHDLIEELRKAVLDGSTRVIAKLIRRVRETGNIDCAQALQGLAGRYDYDAMMRLLGAPTD
jgi:phage-related protein